MPPPVYGSPSQGQVDQESILSNRIKIDMSDLIKRVEPDIAPFTRIVDQLDFMPCTEEKFEFMQADDFSATVTLAAGADAGAAEIVVLSGEYVNITKNMMLRNMRTGEQLFVTATPTTATIAVKPNYPTCSGGAAQLATDLIMILGTAMETGSSPVDRVSLDPERDYNYIEHMRRGWDVSGRVQAIDLYGDGALQFARESNIREFLKQRERKFLFGKRSKTVSTANGVGTITTTGGLRYFMDAGGSSTPQRDFSGIPMTKAEWDDFLKDAFFHGSSKKLMICGWNIMSIIDDWADNKLQAVQGAKEYGLTIKRYESTYGTLDIMPHKAWTNEWGMNAEAWIVELENLKRRGLGGRSDIALTTTRGSDNLQGEGEDATKQEMQVEDGLEFRNVETFARAYGIGV